MCGYSVSFIKILGVLIYHSYLAKACCLCCFSSTQIPEHTGANGGFFCEHTKFGRADHMQKAV